MMADTYVAVAQAGLNAGQQVELSLPTLDLTRIVTLEHVGGEVLRFSYQGLDSTQYVGAHQVQMIRVRPMDEY